MLIEFSIENFRSIRDEVTLSLLSSHDKSLESNTFSSDCLNKNDRLLKSAAIYGPNASGKSNIILAFDTLQKMVLHSIKNQPEEIIEYEPFKLDQKFLQKPTKFKIVFIHNNIQYVYGVGFNEKKIIEEFLYYYPKGRKSTIFERKENINPYFPKDKRIQKQIFDRTLDNVLYLSNSAQQKYDKTVEVFKWFKDNLIVTINRSNFENPLLMEKTIQMLESEESRQDVMNSLYKADVAIYDVNAEFKEIKPQDRLNVKKNYGNFLIRQKGMLRELLEIKTRHKSDSKIFLDTLFDFFSEESDGTQRIFCLIGSFIDALNNGKTIVLDELELRLHPNLSKYLLQLFQDPSKNTKNAQIIFTTHNTNLLSLNSLRKDQIWLIQKDPNNGRSDLYSLAEFNVGNDKNIEKEYLAGIFGATPFISSKESL